MGTGSFLSEIQEHKDIFLLKIGTDLLQIGELFILQIEALVITNPDSTYYYKSGQSYYKSWQLLNIGENILNIWEFVTNWCITISANVSEFQIGK